MDFPENPYNIGFALGIAAFHNGFPKVYPGDSRECYTSPNRFIGWHDGWLTAWKATTEGQIKLGVYS